MCARIVTILAIALGVPSIAHAAYGSDEPSSEELIRPAVGVGMNFTPADPGWQLQLSVMGENLEKALLTQISLGYEVVGTRRSGETSSTGRLSQVVLSPLTIYGGFGGLRVGAGFEVSYGFLPVGQSAEEAKGWGAGGRVGGGLSIHPGSFGLWILGHYRFLSGSRVNGFFIDVVLAPG